jgi:hypothetical protein
MTTKKLAEYLWADPFGPFRIRMASGQSFDIPHPEMVPVGRTSAEVYTATEPDGPDRWHRYSLVMMETLEPIDVPATQANG